MRGDRLLPVNFSDQDTEFVPHAPDADLQGHVISVFDAISQVGAGQVITLNLGANDGIEKGHIFSVSEAGRVRCYLAYYLLHGPLVQVLLRSMNRVPDHWPHHLQGLLPYFHKSNDIVAVIE